VQVKGSAWGLGSSVEDVNSSLRLGRDGRPADSSSRVAVLGVQLVKFLANLRRGTSQS